MEDKSKDLDMEVFTAVATIIQKYVQIRVLKYATHKSRFGNTYVYAFLVLKKQQGTGAFKLSRRSTGGRVGSNDVLELLWR